MSQALAIPERRREEVLLRSGLALLRMCRGEWLGLREQAAALLDELDEYALARSYIELVAGRIALAQGDLREATDRIRVATDLARQNDLYDVIPLAAGASAQAALARHDHEAALPTLDALVEMLYMKGVWAPVCWALPAATEVWLAAGGIVQARVFIDRAEAELSGLDVPLASAALTHARGILAQSADDLAAAAEMYEALHVPYEAARASEQAAGYLLASGDQPDGDTLRAAFTCYQRLGATRDQARAAHLARRHGVTLPANRGWGRKTHSNQLTPREREVAELAGAGRTNKEISEELFVSTSTVEKHLHTVMRKLEVRSRTELAYELMGAAHER